MSREWVGKFDIGLLLKVIKERTKKNKATGEVSFDSMDGKFADALAVLESSVTFNKAIPESIYRRLTFQAVSDTARSNSFTVPSFENQLDRQERAYLQTPPKRYVLTTSLSTRNLSDYLSHTEISNVRITFGERLPKRFHNEHDRMRQYGSNILFGDLPKYTGMIKRYTFARASVSAKSDIEAVESALDGLNLLRGIWNFSLNFPLAWRLSAGQRKPVNKIVLGPIHSLHKPSGELAVDYNWYEPDYVGPLETVRLEQRFDGMRSFERGVRKYLARSRYMTDLEESIRRYGRILDSRDWNNAFVQLWGLLEHLTNTTRSENRVTCKRAKFLFPKDERNLHKEVLDHLAHHRNRAVHAGYFSEDAETLLYQLKRYVERVLRFHLFAGLDFRSRKEAADFLHLPPDLDELQKRMRLTRRAMRFHG